MAMLGERFVFVGVAANSDHMYLNNQSHYSLDVIAYQSEFCDTQSPFKDTIVMNEKCRELTVMSWVCFSVSLSHTLLHSVAYQGPIRQIKIRSKHG